MRLPVALSAALLATGLLAGCSTASPEAAPSSSPSAPASTAASPSPAAVAPKYATAAAVLDALSAAGIPCTGRKPIELRNFDLTAVEAAFCKTTDEAELNAAVYVNSADAKSAPQRQFQSQYGSYSVVGEGWVVSTAMDWKEWLPKVKAALGGELVEIPPTN